MRYAFVERHKRAWPIRVQCRVLRVGVSGYHRHVRRRKQIAQRRHLSDAALPVHIRAAFAAYRGAYGWPRAWRQLLSRDIRVGKSRVQRPMRDSMRSEIVVDALEMAWLQRSPDKDAGPIFHSGSNSWHRFRSTLQLVA